MLKETLSQNSLGYEAWHWPGTITYMYDCHNEDVLIKNFI